MCMCIGIGIGNALGIGVPLVCARDASLAERNATHPRQHGPRRHDLQYVPDGSAMSCIIHIRPSMDRG